MKYLNDSGELTIVAPCPKCGKTPRATEEVVGGKVEGITYHYTHWSCCGVMVTGDVLWNATVYQANLRRFNRLEQQIKELQGEKS